MLKHDEIQSPRGSGEPTARGHSPTTAQRFFHKTSFQVPGSELVKSKMASSRAQLFVAKLPWTVCRGMIPDFYFSYKKVLAIRYRKNLVKLWRVSKSVLAKQGEVIYRLSTVHSGVRYARGSSKYWDFPCFRHLLSPFHCPHYPTSIWKVS